MDVKEGLVSFVVLQVGHGVREQVESSFGLRWTISSEKVSVGDEVRVLG